jgi:integrase
MNEVKFNLKDRGAEESLINLIFRYSGKRLKMSTEITVPVKYWNTKKQKVRSVATYPDSAIHNSRLEKYRRAVREAYRRFERKQEIPTINQLKDAVIECFNGKKKHVELPKTVLGYIDKYMADSISRGRKRGTIQGFSQLKNVISKMPGGKSYEFKDLSEERLHLMIKVMVEKFDYRTSQIHKIQRKLITIVNDAKRTEAYDIPSTFYHKNQSWRVKLSNQSTSGTGIALTPEEVRKIEKLELDKRLDRVRDRFLIGINTGQRYSDFQKLSKDDVVQEEGNSYWDILQQKTKKRVKIPVNESCKRILDKYGGYPPTISKQKFNEYIKEVCKKAEIDEKVKVRKTNPIHGEIESNLVPKWSLVSSHDCRRTTATMMHNKGIPMMQIKRITGHSNLRELEKYLKIDESKPVSALENLY